MSHLNLAYTLGLNTAREVFEKTALDPSTVPQALAGVPGLGPILAGMAGRKMGPQEVSPLASQAAITHQSALGQGIGGLAGGALGAGGLALAKELGLDTDIKPSTAGIIGSLLGSGVGGVLGARRGQGKAREAQAQLDAANLQENRGLTQRAYQTGQEQALAQLFPYDG